MQTALLVVFGSLVVSSSAAHAQDARYRVTFDAVWSDQTHPADFPSANAHFSAVIGGTHNRDASFWALDQLASPGIEAMAETGSTGTLRREVETAINAGTAKSFIQGISLPTSPASNSFVFDVSETHPLVTLVSMIAPSPDWFVGVSDLNLRPNGDWVGVYGADLLPYDAGTDSGSSYGSPNDDTNPADPVSQLAEFPFEEGIALGSFTFLRLLPGDLNESGTHDSTDIDTLSRAIRDQTLDPTFDLNKDASVDLGDHRYWVKQLANTYYGDSNLDGKFDTSDLIGPFRSGEYEDDIANNSTWADGDWNGDFEFSTADLVVAFQDGGYEKGRASVIVPEPCGFTTLSAALGLLAAGLRRIRRSSAT